MRKCVWCGVTLEKYGLSNAYICPGCGAMDFPKEAEKVEKIEESRTFDGFMQQVRDLMEGKAKTKGYHESSADGPNQLYEFVDKFCPSHTEGEIIYKVVRYSSKRDPTDLLKIAAWAFLKWRWRQE